MSELSDFLVVVRNGANINSLALDDVATQARDYLEIVEAWSPSAMRDSLRLALKAQIYSFDEAREKATALRDEAQRSADSLEEDIPPLPPPPDPGEGTIEWSTRDW